ncbi:hypothetical protein P4E94_19580 [Pontiellaceae bacterium B12219]|nr:hypothetical protein [Pontiellaceae bacterium B12219]
MNDRKPIKDAHERFIVDQFIQWWEKETQEQFEVISRPEPPEAIIESSKRKSWIEVTDTFYSDEWAKDLYSKATPEENHIPMEEGFHYGMDEQTAIRFSSLLKQKLSKTSYKKTFDLYGAGILIVVMKSPWFDAETCKMMREACNQTDWTSNKGYFDQVYLSFRSMNQQVFDEWKNCTISGWSLPGTTPVD